MRIKKRIHFYVKDGTDDINGGNYDDKGGKDDVKGGKQ
jgi:hypothetical protein